MFASDGMTTDDGGFEIADIDMGAVVAGVRAQGAVSLPLVGDGTRLRLLEAARRGAYRRARALIGAPGRSVRQDMDVCDDFPPDSVFRAFGRRFEAHLAAALEGIAPYPFATRLRLDDMMLQHYDAGSTGISPHRDHVSYVNLVCLFTLSGRARFGVCDDRAGHAPCTLDAAPGTVVFLRAPGFLGGDARPFHFVGDVEVERYSFGLRQKRR
ncbi:MAG: hypothetical protein ACE5H8_14795 [Alphaproteobacteria bacterium]